MRIAVAGAGYVGFSLAVLLSRQHSVRVVDIVPEKIDLINRRQSPIADRDIQNCLAEESLNLTATRNAESAYSDADFILVATPTDYDPVRNHFATSSIEAVLSTVEKVNPEATVVIKSTVPVGYLESIRKRFALPYLLFSPEFLREGRALHDNLHPSRIIVGLPDDASEELRARAEQFADLLRAGALDDNVPVLLTHSTEAESIKLFSNTYLALRVSFFNELDSYAETNGLNARAIIDGVCLDPRIGGSYNNPSFGYGGYCFPKDTRQLVANFAGTPNNVVSAVVAANETRKDLIAGRILARKPRLAGIYRLTMKTGSDNFRQSAILGILQRLRDAGVSCLIYEPRLSSGSYDGVPVIRDLTEFKCRSDIIVANRLSDDLSDCRDKVYSRDLFLRD